MSVFVSAGTGLEHQISRIREVAAGIAVIAFDFYNSDRYWTHARIWIRMARLVRDKGFFTRLVPDGSNRKRS
jgi:hypothetical protein